MMDIFFFRKDISWSSSAKALRSSCDPSIPTEDMNKVQKVEKLDFRNVLSAVALFQKASVCLYCFALIASDPQVDKDHVKDLM